MSTPAGNLVGDATINVNANTAPASAAMRDFSRDAQGRLRDVRGRFVSESRRINDSLNGTTGALGRASTAVQTLAGASAGLAPALNGAAAAAGLSLAPALGAVVPMAAGAALAAGTLKVAFAGVGEALAASGEGQEEYRESLKKLSAPQREFTQALVDAKKQFVPFTKEIQKATLPGFTAAVKAAGPVVKILGENMTQMGAAFSDAAAGVSRMLKDSGFQASLQTNLKLGTGFVKDMTQAMGPFTRSLLDFGAASGPTLKAFSDGIGGLLTKGLPGFFTGLTPGIGGAAKALDGLFGSVNLLLPAIGRFSGEVARDLGPVIGELLGAAGRMGASGLDALRGAMVLARPIFKDLEFGARSVNDLFTIIGPTMRDTAAALIEAFAPVGERVNSAVGPLQAINNWIRDNKAGIQEASRFFAVAMLEMTRAAINAAPVVLRTFQLMSATVLTALDGIVSGAAHAFGWVPGIGGKLKAANRAFDDFKSGYQATLNAAAVSAQSFADSTSRRLTSGELKLNINNWTSQIATAKEQLKTVPPEKRAALLATIKDLEAKVRKAKEDLASLPASKSTTLTVWKITKIQTQYVNPLSKSGSVHDAVGATGGLFTGTGFKYRGYAHGGLVDGPGTETSDSIFAPWLSKNEFVVNAKRTRQYLPLLKAINSGGMAGGGMAGGGMASAGMDVGRGLASGLSGSMSLVLAAAREMAAAVTAGVRAELQISSPSKVTQALAKDVGAGFIKGLTGSREKIRAVAKDLSNDIRTAFSGRKESGLLKMVTRETNELAALAARRDVIAQRIADANKFATSTAQQASSSFSLASLAGETTSESTILARLKQGNRAIQDFAKNIKTLQAKGLSKGLIRQLLELGPEQGAGLARTIAAQSEAYIKSLNAAQGSITNSSNALGKMGADALYDAGAQAGKGLLAGLKAQQKQIEQLMLSIAKAMQKAIRKALGIKSPSTVMAEVGRQSTIGLALGLKDRLPQVQQAVAALSGSVAGVGGGRSAAAGVAASVGVARTAAASGPGATVINISLTNRGMIGSQRDMEAWLVKTMENLRRTKRLPAANPGS